MLPRRHRLTTAADFQRAMRTGSRRGAPLLVAHVAQAPEQEFSRVGFAVSRSVGNSVVRHRVSRRLRHLVADRLAALPPSALVVIRATPRAASASSADLARDLDRVLGR